MPRRSRGRSRGIREEADTSARLDGCSPIILTGYRWFPYVFRLPGRCERWPGRRSKDVFRSWGDVGVVWRGRGRWEGKSRSGGGR